MKQTIESEKDFLLRLQAEISARIESLSDSDTVKPEKPVNAYKTVILIDCGHGGFSKETGYATAPAKMCRHIGKELHNGPDFYEGVFNRIVGKKLAQKLAAAGIPFRYISEPIADISLTERTNRANIINLEEKAKGRKTVYFSIHGNAAGNGGPQSSAQGFSVFVHTGASNDSRAIAEKLGENVRKILPEMQYRYWKSGIGYWESNLHVLRETTMPAILSENGFFDHNKEVLEMFSESFTDKIAEAHFQTALNLQ